MNAVDDQLPFNLIKAFARSILEGNEIYCNLSNANKLQDVNLSIPDAIRAVRVYTRALKEWVRNLKILQPYDPLNRLSLSNENSFMHRSMFSVLKME